MKNKCTKEILLEMAHTFWQIGQIQSPKLKGRKSQRQQWRLTDSQSSLQLSKEQELLTIFEIRGKILPANSAFILRQVKEQSSIALKCPLYNIHHLGIEVDQISNIFSEDLII